VVGRRRLLFASVEPDRKRLRSGAHGHGNPLGDGEFVQEAEPPQPLWGKADAAVARGEWLLVNERQGFAPHIGCCGVVLSTADCL
jgi:hypothetical protein